MAAVAAIPSISAAAPGTTSVGSTVSGAPRTNRAKSSTTTTEKETMRLLATDRPNVYQTRLRLAT